MSYDVVKRWVNEAQEAASSDNIMVQVGKTRACWKKVKRFSDSWRKSYPPNSVLSPLPSLLVPCARPVVSPQEERSSRRDQDAQQVHKVRPQVPVRLLHADPHCQQTAGRDRWRVSRSGQNGRFTMNELIPMMHICLRNTQPWQPPVWLHRELLEEQERDGGLRGCVCHRPHAQLYCQRAGSCCVRLPVYILLIPKAS